MFQGLTDIQLDKTVSIFTELRVEERCMPGDSVLSRFNTVRIFNPI